MQNPLVLVLELPGLSSSVKEQRWKIYLLGRPLEYHPLSPTDNRHFQGRWTFVHTSHYAQGWLPCDKESAFGCQAPASCQIKAAGLVHQWRKTRLKSTCCPSP